MNGSITLIIKHYIISIMRKINKLIYQYTKVSEILECISFQLSLVHSTITGEKNLPINVRRKSNPDSLIRKIIN